MPHGRGFRVGLIVIGTGVLFVGLLLFILASGMSGQRARYFIRFDENVKGMVIGSKVNFQGVPIGVVQDIRFAGGKTRVELDVDPERAVIQDVTRARLDRLLVTGQITVELEGYAATGKRLPPGSEIQPKDDPLHSLTTNLPEAVEEVMALVGDLRTLVQDTNKLVGPTTQQRVDSILGQAERLAAALPERFERSSDQLEALLAESRETVRRTNALCERLTTSTEPEVRNTLVALQQNVQRLGGLHDDLQAMMAEATGMLAGLRQPMNATLAALRGALDEFRGVARTLRLAPDSLLFGVTRPAEAAAPMGGR